VPPDVQPDCWKADQEQPAEAPEGACEAGRAPQQLSAAHDDHPKQKKWSKVIGGRVLTPPGRMNSVCAREEKGISAAAMCPARALRPPRNREGRSTLHLLVGHRRDICPGGEGHARPRRSGFGNREAAAEDAHADHGKQVTPARAGDEHQNEVVTTVRRSRLPMSIRARGRASTPRRSRAGEILPKAECIRFIPRTHQASVDTACAILASPKAGTTAENPRESRARRP